MFEDYTMPEITIGDRESGIGSVEEWCSTYTARWWFDRDTTMVKVGGATYDDVTTVRLSMVFNSSIVFMVVLEDREVRDDAEAEALFTEVITSLEDDYKTELAMVATIMDRYDV